MAPVKGYHILLFGYHIIFLVVFVFFYNILLPCFIYRKKTEKNVEENTEEFLNIDERIKTFLFYNAEKPFLFTFFTFFIFMF